MFLKVAGLFSGNMLPEQITVDIMAEMKPCWPIPPQLTLSYSNNKGSLWDKKTWGG